MLKIRLQRIGRRNDPAFRVIVTESTRGPKSGNHVELLGSYDSRQDMAQLKADRIKHWIKQGAQVSPTVHNLLINEKVIEGKKINVLPRKSPVIREEKDKKTETAAEKKSQANVSTAKEQEAAEETEGDTKEDTITKEADKPKKEGVKAIEDGSFGSSLIEEMSGEKKNTESSAFEEVKEKEKFGRKQ